MHHTANLDSLVAALVESLGAQIVDSEAEAEIDNNWNPACEVDIAGIGYDMDLDLVGRCAAVAGLELESAMVLGQTRVALRALLVFGLSMSRETLAGALSHSRRIEAGLIS